MTCQILVCDDEPHIVLAVSLKLSKAGFNVLTASDGLAAWEIVQSDRPKLVISDLEMPRLDGLGLVRRIRDDAELRDTPVILLTAKGFELDEDEMRFDYGLQHVLCKPFSPRELLRLVQTQLGLVSVGGFE